MLGLQVGSLFGVLGMDSKGFDAALDSAARKMSGTADGLKSMGGNITGLGQKLSMGLTAPLAAAGAGILKLASDTGAFAEQIQNMAQTTGLSTDRLQELKFVAENAGLSFESVANASLMVQRKLMGVENDSGAAADALKRMGISVKDASGQLLSMDILFPQLITKLQSMTNVTERNMLATQLFGRGAGEIIPLLGMSAEEFAKASKQAHEFGNVLSGDALKKAAAFDDTMDMFTKQMEGFKNTIGTALIEKLTGLLNWFMKAPAPVQLLVGAFVGLVALGGPILMFVGSLITAWGTVIAVAPAVATAATAAWTAITGPVGLVIAAIALVAGGVYLIYKNWDTIKAFFGKLWDGVKIVFTTVWEWIKAFFFNYTPQGLIIKHWDKIVGLFGAIWTGVKTGIAWAWDGIKTLFFNYTPQGLIIKHWDTIKGYFRKLWDVVYDITVGRFMRIVNWIGDKCEKIGGFFKGLYDKVVGHSIVPDLVDGIEKQMNRLGGKAMVKPVLLATNQAGRAFEGMSGPQGASAGERQSAGVAGTNNLIRLMEQQLDELRRFNRLQVQP